MTRQQKPWWSGETPVALLRVPEILPSTGNGRALAPSSVYRWCRAGVHGVKLRRFKSGFVWFTTVQELERFQAGVTLAAGEPVV